MRRYIALTLAFIGGAAASQFTRNVDLTQAVGLVFRTVAELAGFFIMVALMVRGGIRYAKELPLGEKAAAWQDIDEHIRREAK